MSNDDYTIQILDLSGNEVVDPTNAKTYLQGISFQTEAGKGYTTFSAFANRDTRKTWQVRGAYEIILRFRGRIVYEGRLDVPEDSSDSTNGETRLTAFGPFIYLQEERLRKRWIDADVVNSGRLEWPTVRDTHLQQNSAIAEIAEKRLVRRIAPDDTVIFFGELLYYDLYQMPIGTKVKSVSYKGYWRTGEGLRLTVFNEDAQIVQGTPFDTLQAPNGTGYGGSATAGSAGSTLIDNTANFVALGVQPGYSVKNTLNDGTGTVTAVVSPTQLTVPLNGTNVWALGHGYVVHIPVQNTVTFPSGGTSTESFTFRFGAAPYTGLSEKVSDTYDQNDVAKINDIVVKGYYNTGHPRHTLEAYTSGEVIQDVVIINTRISNDVNRITDPGVVLTSFITEDDSYQTHADIISKLASYSDSLQNTYYLYVYGRTGTSDNRPRAIFEKRDVTDYDYVISSRDNGITFTPKVDDVEIYNWVILSRVDEKDITRYLTPDTFTVLKNDASIAQWGRRMSPVIDCGQCTQSNALDIGKRYLNSRKQPPVQASIQIANSIQTKGGTRVPICWVYSGQRIKVIDYGVDGNGNYGIIFFIGGTSVDVDSDTLSITTDRPPNTLDVLFSQQGQDNIRF